MIIRPLALRPECGRNFDLHTALRGLLGSGEQVSLWIAYQVQPWVYWRPVQQKENLESGQMRYKAIDIGFPARRVADCIHAVNRIVFTCAAAPSGRECEYKRFK